MEVALILGDKEGVASTGLGFGLQYLLNALPQVGTISYLPCNQTDNVS